MRREVPKLSLSVERPLACAQSHRVASDLACAMLTLAGSTTTRWWRRHPSCTRSRRVQGNSGLRERVAPARSSSQLDSVAPKPSSTTNAVPQNLREASGERQVSAKAIATAAFSPPGLQAQALSEPAAMATNRLVAAAAAAAAAAVVPLLSPVEVVAAVVVSPPSRRRSPCELPPPRPPIAAPVRVPPLQHAEEEEVVVVAPSPMR